jgi:hypothetical protein
MKNLFSNTEISENFERRIQVEKLTPIGREIIENYKHVRVDDRTIKLVKPKGFKLTVQVESLPKKKRNQDDYQDYYFNNELY